MKREAGFTVVEMAVTVALLSIVLTTLLGVLDAQTRASRRVEAVVNNQEDVRFALLALARDVRAADPLGPLPDVGAYATRVELQLRDATGASLGWVRWWLDTATGVITRADIAGPGGSVMATSYRLSRVRNAQSALPLFRYYNSAGVELTAVNATAADFANCTVRVHLAVEADTNPGPRPFRIESDAEVRNRLPGGIGC